MPGIPTLEAQKASAAKVLGLARASRSTPADGPNGSFYEDEKTRSLGFFCDNTFYGDGTRGPKCTREQSEAVRHYERTNTREVVAKRYYDNLARLKEQADKDKANKPAYDYAAEISKADPMIKDQVRRAMIEKGFVRPGVTEWNTECESALVRFYSGPLTIGSSTAYAAKLEAAKAQRIKDQNAIIPPVSFDPADMRAEALQRRAANMASADSQTINDELDAATRPLVEAQLVAQRKDILAASDVLVRAVVDQSTAARGFKGATPVAPIAKAAKPANFGKKVSPFKGKGLIPKR